MSLPLHTVLLALVDIAGESNDPVTLARVAESVALPETAVADSLESLQEFELVAKTGDGYRPTVTAHDLLAADIDLDDTLVLEMVDN